MSAPSYLLKKHDTYYFRQACDPYLKSRVGKREIVRSFGVKDKAVAVRMAREFKVNLDYIIDNLSADLSVSSDNATRNIDECFIKIKNKYICLKSYRIIGSPFCFSPPPASQPPAPALQSQSTEIAQSLKTVTGVSPETLESPLTTSPSPPSEGRTRIRPLFEKYSLEKTRLKQWSPKTQKERTSHLELILNLLECIKNSKEIFLENITKQDVRKIKELLLLLPKNHNKFFPKTSLGGLLKKCTDVESGKVNGLSRDAILHLQDKISINTISDKYVSTVRGFWNWLNQQDYTDSRVFDVLKYDFKKVTNSWKSFSAADLTRLFNDKIYTDHKYQFNSSEKKV